MNNNENVTTKTRQLLAASALVPLLCALSQPPNFKALIYSVFIINYLINTRSRDHQIKQNKQNKQKDTETVVPEKTTFSVWQKLEFVGLFVACGMIVQTLDYLGHLSFPVQTQWSPDWLWFSNQGQPVWQLVMTFRVMVALSIAWLVALRFFVFSQTAFVRVAAIFGALLTMIDYLPAISLPIFSAMLASAVYYGSIAGIAATPLNLGTYNTKSGEKRKSILTIMLLLAAVKLVTYLTPIPAALGAG
ncbi:MAG: hypothetical protein WCT03_20535 [Candidatus Obscuribacterales bacterium]